MSVFPFDPRSRIETSTPSPTTSSRSRRSRPAPTPEPTSTCPSHFIEGGRTVDELAAEEFVWPAYKIDVRGMTFTDNFVEQCRHRGLRGRARQIKKGSLVDPADRRRGVLRARRAGGRTDASTHGSTATATDQLADNTDDLFDFVNAGFSGRRGAVAVRRARHRRRRLRRLRPDAATDELRRDLRRLLNDGVALVGLANLDSVSVRKDVIMAPTGRPSDGSGFSDRSDRLPRQDRRRRGSTTTDR